jgi:glyoxylase-like metal-dependent hydrolase (beta-lactamase superfamily II)
MKTINYLFQLCFLMFFPFIEQSQVFTNAELSITKLSNGVWVIETTDKNTMYIVEGDDKALLIDTGTKCHQLDSIVRLITQKPLYVVITHQHPDHTGNVNDFSEIYYHAADTVLLYINEPYKGKTHFINDGDLFDLGNRKISVVWMPGHTPGSIVLVDRKSGSCFSGDAFGSGQVWLQLKPYSTISTYIASCQRMEKLMEDGITKLYCGHYPFVKAALDKSYIDSMIELATGLKNGNAPESKPYDIKVSIGGDNPMLSTLGQAGIVYDPEMLK